MEDNNINELSNLVLNIQDCFKGKQIIQEDGETKVVYPTSKTVGIEEYLVNYNKNKEPRKQISLEHLKSPYFWENLYF